MADLQPIQQSFESGEISPKLLARGGTDRYSSGLAICENFLPNSHGPVDFRGGRQYIGKPGDDADDQDLRIFGLNINLTESYVCTVGGSFVQVFDRDGPVYDGPEFIELIFNPFFAGALAGWGSDVVGNQLNEPPIAMVEWSDSQYVTLAVTDVSGQADLIQPTTIVTTGAVHDLILDLALLPFSDPASVINVRVGSAEGLADIVDTTLGPGYGQTVQFTPGLTLVWIALRVDTEATWLVDRVSLKEDWSALPIARWASPWNNLSRDAIFVEPHPTINALTFWHPGVEPYELAVDASNNWTFVQIPLVASPWSGKSWPLAATFFQGRLWVGGVDIQPTTFWGSKSNDYYNFTGGTQPDDSVEYTIAKKGRIAWMSGVKNLVVGTEFVELLVTSEGGVIIPGDISVDEQSSYGSLAGQIVELGREVVYASSSEVKLRTMAYQWTEDAWVSQDLAWPSEHITQGRIKELAYASEPDQIIWIVDRRNRLLSCSYNREQRIVGWTRHPTQARVLSVTTVKLFGVDEVWVMSEYETSGGPAKSLERYSTAHYQDSYITVAGVDMQDDISGFFPLEGMTVKVTVDGSIHPDRVVIGGAISLQSPGNTVTVGLGYEGRLVTLPIEGGSQQGSQQGVTKRYNAIYVRLVASIMPYINGEIPPDRTPSTLMDTREPARTEDVSVYNEGWDKVAQVEVLQVSPFPTQVVGLFGELQANKR